MLFNSFVFLFFFLVVYSLYLAFRKRYKAQNVLLLIASYVFYGYWDWRFLSLIAISTVIDYFAGRAIPGSSDKRKKRLVALSMVSNLTMLGFFKYFNFFADSVADLLSMFGMQPDFITLNIVLPVGISFYTFQTMSYTVDIYRGKLEPAESFLDFALFVSFFPQLVAGPIERASRLLPQISSPRKIDVDQINAGVFLIIWGYYKKVVIADNLAIIANQVFNNHTDYQGLDILAGILAFTFQIYGDFSGYSDIARGISKLMGIDLMVNFKLPYFALNPSDFWLRWHVSLSSWLRDYLYIPLGGNRHGEFNTYRNLFLTMLLGGLWHGAAWNFVIWGLYHGVILILYRVFDRNPEHMDPWGGEFSKVRVVLKMAFMFVLTIIGWVIFRSESAGQIWYMLTHVGVGFDGLTGFAAISAAWKMFWSAATGGGVSHAMLVLENMYKVVYFSLPLIIVQVVQYGKRNLLAPLNMHPVLLTLFYAYLLTWIALLGVRGTTEFIYFQF